MTPAELAKELREWADRDPDSLNYINKGRIRESADHLDRIPKLEAEIAADNVLLAKYVADITKLQAVLNAAKEVADGRRTVEAWNAFRAAVRAATEKP